ncbi:hypothetical protein F2P81_023232 [Scophthalmus maximus]|uniref:Uncharacterized protein n=1 Tax=Scophthalmus maximus TaxID=52904 RepID=A0A6A4RYM4_SCOMX|nr:hypothetical protein F2P81_023232 [Scophthalmus maximus]
MDAQQTTQQATQRGGLAESHAGIPVRRRRRRRRRRRKKECLAKGEIIRHPPCSSDVDDAETADRLCAKKRARTGKRHIHVLVIGKIHSR